MGGRKMKKENIFSSEEIMKTFVDSVVKKIVMDMYEFAIFEEASSEEIDRKMTEFNKCLNKANEEYESQCKSTEILLEILKGNGMLIPIFCGRLDK